MKRIVIEAYSLDTPYVGVGEFCNKLFSGIVKKSSWLRENYGIELYFIVSPHNNGCLGNDVKYISVNKKKRWILLFYPFSISLFYAPHQYCKCLKYIRAKKKLMTVHDVNFFYEKTGSNLEREIFHFKKKVNKVDYINYISNFSQEDTENHFHTNKSCGVIYNGVTNLSDKVIEQQSFDIDLPKSFMFHISSLLPKKNVHLLIEMMDYLPERNLLIVGDWNHPYGEENIQKIRNSKYNNIYILSNITEDQKAYLYSKCEAFLFPSLCEGFGLPPVEAMSFGKPVFLSRLTSLPEIGGDVAFYWDELEPQKMAKIVQEKMILFNSDSNYSYRIKGNSKKFNWDDCVRGYLDLFIKYAK